MLIDTKFVPPVLTAGLIPREALLRQLDVMMEGRLAIVSAPAGFGKTTLVGQWCARARQRGIDVAWISLSARENEPGRMLDYVIGALARVSGDIVATLPGIVDGSPTLPMEAILTRLINGIAAWRRDLVLVIDDVHYLTNPEIGAALDTLIAYAPPNFRLLLATRGAVPVTVATLRVRGQMVRLDDTALRFSLDEATAFLNESRGLALELPDVLALHNRTEGWVAGLQLASLSLAKQADRAWFLTQFSGASGDIAEFLMQNVIGRLPDDLRIFLMRTAILDAFDAGIAEAVTGQADASAKLHAIEAANLFLVPLNPQRTLFRYHHMFADLLRAMLLREQPQEVPRLHRLAAERLVALGQTAEGVHHALAAGDNDLAAGLVLDCCMPLIRQSHLTRVRDWLSRLPPALIERHTRLLLAKVWIEFQTSRPRSAATALIAARASLRRSLASGALPEAEARALSAEVAVLTAGVFSSAERPRAAVRIGRAHMARIPPDQPFLKGTLGNILGFSLYSLGDFAAARTACLTARDHHADADSVFGVVYSDLILGLVEKGAGNLDAAGRLFNRASQTAADTLGTGSYAEAMAGIFRVELHYEWNDLAEAERLLGQHRALIEECGLVVHDIAAKLHVARLAAAQGRTDEALAVLERAERQGVRNRYRRLIASALNDRVRLLLLRGETAMARHLLATRGVVGVDPDTVTALSPASELEQIAFSRVLIAENRPAAAIRILERLAETLLQGGRLRRLAQVRAVASIAAFQTGDGLATLAAIVDTVALCRRQGAVRTLIDEGEALRAVLQFGRDNMPSWRSRSEVAVFLEKVMGPAVLPQARTPGSHTPQPKFSPKEAEVARRLTEGMANRDIAAALSMAPDTVKWHLKNIFGKLGVDNRTQAVLQLRDAGLLARLPEN